MAGDFSEFSGADFEAACILFSLSSSSSSSTLTFIEWRKIQQSRALEQVITRFEYLQTVMGHTVEEALAMLKVEYKSNDKFVNAIEGYEFLISHEHNRDEMLMILKAANGGIVKKKKETQVQSKNREKEKSSSLKAPMMRMKGKKQKEGEKERVYKCKLCSLSFSTGQALGGHTTYHWKMIEVDAGEMELKPQFDFDMNDSQNDVDCNKL